MTKNIKTRVADIEARLSPKATTTWRRVVGNSPEECDALIHSLLSAGHASPADKFTCRVMVAPSETHQ